MCLVFIQLNSFSILIIHLLIVFLELIFQIWWSHARGEKSDLFRLFSCKHNLKIFLTTTYHDYITEININFYNKNKKIGMGQKLD